MRPPCQGDIRRAVPVPCCGRDTTAAALPFADGPATDGSCMEAAGQVASIRSEQTESLMWLRGRRDLTAVHHGVPSAACIAAASHDIGTVDPILLVRDRSRWRRAGWACGDLAQRTGDIAFAPFHAHDFVTEAAGRPSRLGMTVSTMALKDRRNASHDMDIAKGKTPVPRRHRIVDQCSAIGDTSHTQAGFVQLPPGGFVVTRREASRASSRTSTCNAKGRSDRIGGDVIMGGPDAARGERPCHGRRGARSMRR